MKELVKHIEFLLLEHDCVVVPQVGGFVTSNIPARYVEEENIFLPPMRTVGFNEQLKTDDGLLIRSYMTTYRCSDVEAKRMLGEQIRDLQQELWENNIYDLGNIGVLSMDNRNTIHFSPCQAGALSMDYYGLDAIVLEKKIMRVAERRQSEVKTAPIVRTNSSNEITITLKKSWIQNFIVAAASVIIFFALSPNVHNTGYDKVSQASFTQLMMVSDMMGQTKVCEATVEQSDIDVEQITDEVCAEVVSEPVAEDVEPEIKKPVSEYCVVVASAIPERNAVAYVNQLKKSGYDGAQVSKNSGMIRVVFPGYSTEAEATIKLTQLREASLEFAHAWIYRIK